MTVNDIKNGAKEYALSLGIEMFGVASAEAFGEEFPDKVQPGVFVKGARSIIVIGMPYQPSTLSSVFRAKELLPFYDDPEEVWKDDSEKALRQGGAGMLFITHGGPACSWFVWDEKFVLYMQLNMIAYRMNTWLRRHGARAFHFTVNTKDAKTQRAPFELRPAAYMAGVGTLGDNGSILSPEFGPGIQYTAIITDAEMNADGPLEEDVCIHCKKCIKICPVQALSEGPKVDKSACYCCYRCLAICPVGDRI
jgi:epoxyqueuosine reductase QueG